MRGIKVSSFLRAGSWAFDVAENLFSRNALRSYLAEFISTFIFVFAGAGSATSAGKMMTTSHAASPEASLVATALAHGLALCSATHVACDVSGGHLNPAVTFGFVVGGHIGLLAGICYCGAQLLGATLACVLLNSVMGGQTIPSDGLDPEMTGMGATGLECVATFTLVYCAYAAWDPRNGPDRSRSPVAIGFIYGANILALGPFTGGSMNPARSFGPAVATGNFRSHWIYWAGPIVGGGLAGLVYENSMPPANNEPPPVHGVV